MDLVLPAVAVLLLVFVAAFNWHPANKIWAKVAITVFSAGIALFAWIGLAALFAFQDIDKRELYGFSLLGIVVGAASIGAVIACGIGIWRNRR